MKWKMIVTSKSRRYAFIMSVAFVFVAQLFVVSGQTQARSTQEIENSLQHGVSTAVNWDTACRDYLRNNAQNVGWPGSPNLRHYINWGASYQGDTWVSARGRANMRVPIEVDYGAESIDLQLNDVQFLCAALVSPNLSSDNGLTGSALVNDNQRWVTSIGDANDRAPNPIGSSRMLPSLVLVSTKILSANGKDNLSGSSRPGSVSVDIVNKTLNNGRDERSRYWISKPVSFSYNFSSPAVRDGSISVNTEYKRLSGYYANVRKMCVKTGGGATETVSSIDECAVRDMNFNIAVRIRAGFLLDPTISVAPPTISDDGESKISVNAQTANKGSATSDNVDWVVSRFVVAPGGSLSKNAGRSHPKDNFSGYREYTSQYSGNKQFITGGANIVANYEDDQAKYPMGTQLCYVNSVSQQASGNRNWEHSKPACVTISKVIRPKVQVWGGDIKTNDQVITGITKSHRGNNLIPGVSDDNTIHNSQQHWLFGKCAHLDFGSFGTPDPIARKISRCMQGNEGSTVASDKNGSVQFFTDGLQVYYSDGSVMDNGQGIGSTSTTTQAAASFPIEGNKYVVVTSSAASENGKTGDLRYSIVDMSRTGSGGKKGVVTIKNQSFGPQGANHKVGEALAVSVNAARDGYWVIAHLPGTTTMRAFSVPYKWNGSNGGALTPTDSTVGIVVAGTRAGNQAPGFGTINFNNSNSKAVIATSGYTMNANSVIKIMNFNNSTTGSDAGKFSLIKEWQVDKSSDTFVYSADFSPKEDYVYVTSLYNNVENGYLSRYRYDVSGVPNKEVVVGKNSSPAQAFPKCTLDGNRRSGGQVRRAPNGKMYVANRGCQTIGVIANPDATNIANIGWRPSGQGLAGATSVYGLPQAAAVNVADIPFTVIANYAYYGSWGEYGITAKDKIESASGAGLSSSFDGRSVDGGAQSYNRLTFANNAASAFGNFTTNPVIGSYSTPSIKPKNSNRLSGSVDISGLNGEYETSGTLQLTGGTLAAGRNVVIRSRGAVKVSGDLLYGAISKASQVPQLVIYARSIIIEPGVKEVNAWLITPNDGYVSTCGDVVGPDRWLTNLSVSDCNKNQLKINGPIMAGHLYLRRTYGGQHDSPAQNNHSMHPGTPAEILNLRADAYMWGYNYSKNSGAIRTVNLKELPPRY